jgi:hypothetical protein
MGTRYDADTLPLNDDTLDRLDAFAASIGKTPGEAAAALLRDLLADVEFWKAAQMQAMH